MARAATPQKTHRLKDFCTIEQASYIAQEAILRHEAARRFLTPHRKLHRFLKRKAASFRAAFSFLTGD